MFNKHCRDAVSGKWQKRNEAKEEGVILSTECV